MIVPGMVVKCADGQSRAKGVQPSNWEWVVAIVCINRKDWDVSPFLAIQDINYLVNWYSETDLERD
jgi:hypothetical protein